MRTGGEKRWTRPPHHGLPPPRRRPPPGRPPPGLSTPGGTRRPPSPEQDIECQSQHLVSKSTPPVLYALPVTSRLGTERSPLAERKRQAVRDHLTEVALQLLTDRDFEAVTVDEIAAAAGVSRRTFFRYFPSKEEVVLGFLDRMGRLLRDAIVARPADEPPLRAVHTALRPRVAAYSAAADRTLALVRLLQRSPSLRAQELERRQRLRELVAEAIAIRLGLDRRRDLRPRLLAAIALVPFDVAITMWLDGHPADDVRLLLDEAIACLNRELKALA
jgi:AcrR family transcriptional regulator